MITLWKCFFIFNKWYYYWNHNLCCPRSFKLFKEAHYRRQKMTQHVWQICTIYTGPILSDYNNIFQLQIFERTII